MDEKNNIMNEVDEKMNGCNDEWMKRWKDEKMNGWMKLMDEWN